MTTRTQELWENNKIMKFLVPTGFHCVVYYIAEHYYAADIDWA